MKVERDGVQHKGGEDPPRADLGQSRRQAIAAARDGGERDARCRLGELLPPLGEFPPSLGVDRALLAFLIDAYEKEADRTVLHLHPRLAPFKVAVFPLVRNKPDIVDVATRIEKSLRPSFRTTLDDSGNVGKRYYRQDEIGTPYCVTVDYESLEHHDVTVRDRDTKEQVRVSIDKLETYLRERL